MIDQMDHVSDLLPESALGKAISAIVAGLLIVEPELISGLVVVIALNAVASVWYAMYAEDRTAALVLHWLVTRIMVYVLTIAGVVVLSNMLDLPILRRIAFAGVAGWEVAVTLGLGARISPQFAPLYRKMVVVIDENTPIDIDRQGIEDSITNGGHTDDDE